MLDAQVAVIGAIVGEFFASYADQDVGLGVLVTGWLKQYHTDRVFAAVALASLLGLLRPTPLSKVVLQEKQSCRY